MKRVLLIAFHFPPVLGSSGVQRTLKFSQYLPEYGWECSVLSVHERAYEATNQGQLAEIRLDTPVTRAFGLDTARHLRIMGGYPGFLALPDRWVSWVIGAVPAGLLMIRRWRPSVLWCTYPIASAYLIGWILSKLTGVPLVADFRDSMTEPDYPENARKRRMYQWIESKVIHHARRSVFTTPGARSMYLERYPDVPPEHLVVIENAFDEENFQAAETALGASASVADKPQGEVFRLVHSGIAYPQERDPTALFKAIARAKSAEKINAERFRLVFRASGHDDAHARLAALLGISELVEFAPPISYKLALQEILCASGLLLMQSAECNHQIPAKVYEYFRAGRPILALTDSTGDTAAVLRKNSVCSICAMDDENAIYYELLKFIDGVNSGSIRGADGAIAQHNTRQARTVQLADVLQQVVEIRR